VCDRRSGHLRDDRQQHRDPVSRSLDGRPVTVTVDGSQSAWHPATAVVFAGRTAGECAGPSAAACCGYMNFFTTRASAAAWAAAQPEISGGILDQESAVRIGIAIFGELLR
jgi:hypothetical protein